MFLSSVYQVVLSFFFGSMNERINSQNNFQLYSYSWCVVSRICTKYNEFLDGSSKAKKWNNRYANKNLDTACKITEFQCIYFLIITDWEIFGWNVNALLRFLLKIQGLCSVFCLLYISFNIRSFTNKKNCKPCSHESLFLLFLRRRDHGYL